MSYFKHCGRVVDPQNISCAHGQFRSSYKNCQVYGAGSLPFCFELERMLFFEFELWVLLAAIRR